jgi:hypothetical protein
LKRQLQRQQLKAMLLLLAVTVLLQQQQQQLQAAAVNQGTPGSIHGQQQQLEPQTLQQQQA